ncbi:MAG TPA: type II toxin-antitoxin system HipA family toxin [Steroidobacteraceae bacterium]|nr:type II toxin-antitoxin system HipA family toxin [Steroidobacteraceae bacterium]
MELSVFVLGRLVARLFRERDQYVLQYEPGVAVADFVSLTMPVQASPWLWPRDLHPFFRQNLPEGYLLSILREVLGSALDGTDLSLLAVVGRKGIGRVTVIPAQERDHAPEEPLDLKALLHEDFSPKYFDDLVRRYARSAVSGVVPKFLSPEIPPESPESARATLRTARYLVKGSSNLPYLAFNEHHTMRVLTGLNRVPVARTQLSDDGQVLLVERFDVDAHGVPTHGVEDACSLLGLPPHEKYAPSMERVLKATEAYLPDATRQSQLETLGYHLLTNFVVRNADCHSKNIALYYTSLDDVAFTPVYDLVTTQAYDGFRDSAPALSIEGRKTWIPGKTLPHFFTSRLGISTRRYSQMLEELCDSAIAVGRDLAKLAGSEKRWRGIIKNMLYAWDQGIQDVRNTNSTVSLAPVIKNAGFSDYRKPAPAPRTGQSPLLAKRRSSPRVRKRKGESRL